MSPGNVSNSEVSRILLEIALFLDMQGIPFKPRAYEKAAHTIKALDSPVAQLYRQGGLKELQKLPGVGRSIAETIAEFIETSKSSHREELYAKTPVDIAALTAVEGVGPKAVKTLWEKLEITSLEELEEAARQGKIRKLPSFGEKSEEKILRGIEFLKLSSGRFLLSEVMQLVTDIQARLEGLPQVKKVAVAGSIRRRRETVRDADLLVVPRKLAEAGKIMKFVVSMPEVVHVHGSGQTKTSVKLQSGMDMDVRVVPRESYGAALNYFTGSQAHNIALRQLAIKKKLKLNEYGVFRGSRRVAGATEEEVYAALGLPYIPPELREGRGEVEAAREGRLPELIEQGAIKGDLQIQTDWTDGANSIEEMVEGARRLGLTYMAITDHTRGLAMTGGCDERKLRQQMAAIDKINEGLEGFTLLKGAEVNITKDGSLDISDEVLSELDVVGVAVHSHFGLSRAEMTRRIIRAMKNPNADILFHPTGRVIQRREAYEVDIDAIIAAARETGTLLELDAFPNRLDLKDDHVRKVIGAGLKIVIDSDAHSTAHIAFLKFGIDQARRGWARKEDVLNTLPVEGFLQGLKKREAPRA